MRAALAGGSPVALGFTVFESFESEAVERTGLMPMPALAEGVLGGHAVAAFGYDDATRCFTVRNSWGPAWGLRGYFLMPYDFVSAGLADDFWQVQVFQS
jgi:C1A family cysteine protease